MLNSLLWSKQIKINTQTTAYKAAVKMTLTYESECWQLLVKTSKSWKLWRLIFSEECVVYNVWSIHLNRLLEKI